VEQSTPLQQLSALRRPWAPQYILSQTDGQTDRQDDSILQ